MQKEDIFKHLDDGVYMSVFNSIVDCYSDKQKAFEYLFAKHLDFKEFIKFYNVFKKYNLVINNKVFLQSLKNILILNFIFEDGFDVYSEIICNNPTLITRCIKNKYFELVKFLYEIVQIPIQLEHLIISIESSDFKFIRYLLDKQETKSLVTKIINNESVIQKYLSMFLELDHDFHKNYIDCLIILLDKCDYQTKIYSNHLFYNIITQSIINSFENDLSIKEYGLFIDIYKTIHPYATRESLLETNQYDDMNVIEILKKYNLTICSDYIESLFQIMH